MYPLWIRLTYTESGKTKGYTANVLSKQDLVKVIIRLEINLSDIQSFIINDKIQPQKVIKLLFEEVDRFREEERLNGT